jgi:hypothetical protein
MRSCTLVNVNERHLYSFVKTVDRQSNTFGEASGLKMRVAFKMAQAHCGPETGRKVSKVIEGRMENEYSSACRENSPFPRTRQKHRHLFEFLHRDQVSPNGQLHIW